MDAVLSFFALEHVTDPRAFVCAVHGLLKEGGAFYFLVPNIFANTADLVVADHVNHFSVQSLQRLLVDAGFTVREISGEAHNSAWVVVAEKGEGVGVEAETKSISQSFMKWQRTGTSLVIAFQHSRKPDQGRRPFMARAFTAHSFTRAWNSRKRLCVSSIKIRIDNNKSCSEANRIAGSLAGNSAAIVCRA